LLDSCFSFREARTPHIPTIILSNKKLWLKVYTSAIHPINGAITANVARMQKLLIDNTVARIFEGVISFM